MCTIITISWIVFKCGMTVDLCMAYLLMLVLMTLTLMTKVVVVRQRQKFSDGIISTTKQATSIELTTMIGHFLHDLDFANVYMA